jgi:lipid-A-disaccharide synthase
MTADAPARTIYFVVGESSGDALGADLMDHLARMEQRVDFIGLAGPKMQARGMQTLFDISRISVMGISDVLARLPSLANRIRHTASDICRIQPDAVVLIDSPEFAFRVARRVKRKFPAIPIIKYICPSVWAWRPGRAADMAGYLDHVLAILPFEPQLLADLGGPPATYVGHPLVWEMAQRPAPAKRPKSGQKNLLILPGSRLTEVRLLLSDFQKTLEVLQQRNPDITAVLPAVDHIADEIRQSVSKWSVRPEIVTGEDAKRKAFEEADVALAASGTVLLELALYRIPMISIYRLDWLTHMVRHLITGWSAALPNLIADEAFVPERIGDMVRPGWFARAIEALLRDGPERQSQLEGFERMAARMHTSQPPGMLAALKIDELIRNRSR